MTRHHSSRIAARTAPKCQYDKCRKSATVAQQYEAYFGKRVSMRGPDQDTYILRVTVRCPAHFVTERVTGTMGIMEYMSLCEEAQSAPSK